MVALLAIPWKWKLPWSMGGNDLGASLPSDRMTTVFSTDHPKKIICHCYREGEKTQGMIVKIDVGRHWDKQTTSKHLMPHTQSEDFFMLVVLAILSSILLTNDSFQEQFGSVLGLILETLTDDDTISRVHGWSNLPRTQGVTSKVIQWGLKKTHSQTTCKWPTNHLKHILDIVVWIPNFSMPDFSFVGAVWSKPHWEDKNMLEPYFFLCFKWLSVYIYSVRGQCKSANPSYVYKYIYTYILYDCPLISDSQAFNLSESRKTIHSFFVGWCFSIAWKRLLGNQQILEFSLVTNPSN